MPCNARSPEETPSYTGAPCTGRGAVMIWHIFPGLALVALHHATAQPGALLFRRLARPHLQAQPRWQGAGHARPVRQAAETVRLGPRNGVSVRERSLCGGAVELAGTEADLEAVGVIRRAGPSPAM